jgi:hypothetical protein
MLIGNQANTVANGGLMARKKLLKTKSQITLAEDEALQSKTGCLDRIMNSVVNTSIILMSTMMGAFTQVILNTTSAMASGIAEAMGGEETEKKANEEFKQKLPEVDEKIKAMISDIRQDIYAQMGQKRKEIEPLLSDPVFEVGPKIIEKYDFKLPMLTQELDDNALSQYSQLLVNEDQQFTKMFKELTIWINSLPKPSEQNNRKLKKAALWARKGRGNTRISNRIQSSPSRKHITVSPAALLWSVHFLNPEQLLTRDALSTGQSHIKLQKTMKATNCKSSILS